MSYISLYRKYRPKTFSDVVGQDVIVEILKNSIINDKLSHAYIFSGPRGTGKTSIAKIFSKAVNCLNNKTGDLCCECDVCNNSFEEEIDIIEIDAASNNGVDEIREIRNNVKLLPSNLKYKVYIIDEVHMLSTSAFNALLKTLEEPPKHVIFILATTEFNKIPSTVISRCQKFDFKKISNNTIIKRLKYILESEERILDDEIVKLIAEISDGGLRDAINLMDQVLSFEKKEITKNDIYNMIGEISDDEIIDLLDSIVTSNIEKILLKLEKYYDESKNFINVTNRLENLIKDILIFNSTEKYFSEEYQKKLYTFSRIDVDKLLELSKLLFELSSQLIKTNNQKVLSEIYFIKASLLFESKNNIVEKSIEKETIEETKHVENSAVEEVDTLDENILKIRINNALCNAELKLKKEFISKYDSIKEYVSSKDYNAIANLLLKASPEVISDKNIIFTFKNNFEVVLFNKNYDDIQKFLKMLYNVKYVLVAVTDEEWKLIKNQYISDKKNGIKYEYIEEKQTKKKSVKNTELQNSLENIFGSDYITM